MNLVLTVRKSPSGGAPAGTSCTVDESGATIGRSEKNTWVLPSVEGDGLSRFHCRIVFDGGVFSVIDTKSAYGVFVNDARVKAEARTRLNEGDCLRLGEYDLLVQIEAPNEIGLEAPPAEPESPPWDLEPTPEPWGSQPQQGIQPWEPDPESEPAPAPISLGHGSPETDMIEVMPGPRRIIPSDWDRPNPNAGRTAAQPIPPFSRPAAPPIAPVSKSAPSIDGLASFIAGTGQRDIDPGLDPSATLRAVGETYRVAVEGIWEILKSRDEVKKEFGIERTRVAVAENNPMKKTDSANEALAAMIAGHRSGFMPPAAAMREAVRDIKEHEMALIAAIQVALKRVLEQIDPKTLTARLEKRWDDLVPGARKARFWEIYELKHAEIARELEEDFQGAFGKAFAQAYEQYVRQR